MGTFKFYSLRKFQLHNTVLKTVVSTLYLRSSHLIHLTDETLSPITNHFLFTASPFCPPLPPGPQLLATAFLLFPWVQGEVLGRKTKIKTQVTSWGSVLEPFPCHLIVMWPCAHCSPTLGHGFLMSKWKRRTPPTSRCKRLLYGQVRSGRNRGGKG